MQWLNDRLVLPALLLGCLLPCPGGANDAAFGGAGADLVPLVESRIQMVSEDIRLERTAPGGYRILGGGEWRVHAIYRLKSLSAEPVEIQIGFPEPACPEDGDCSFSGFEDMTTLVRGVETPLTVGTVAPHAPWAGDIGRVHLFSVRFAPNETVEVVHDYRHGLSEQVNGGEEIRYITRTGAPWAGPIEHAHFRLELPFRPWGMGLGGWDAALMGLRETLGDGQTRVELDFQRSDWEPASDLTLYLGPGTPTLESPSLIADCPAPADLFDLAMDAATLQTKTLLARTEGLSSEQLRRCRNAVFAHHGKVFEDSALNDFFYGPSGLKIHPSNAPGFAPSAVFARNPDFAPAMLTPSERAYVSALQRAEQGR